MKITEDKDNTIGYFIATKPSLVLSEKKILTNTIVISKINLIFSSMLSNKTIKMNNTILETINLS